MVSIAIFASVDSYHTNQRHARHKMTASLASLCASGKNNAIAGSVMIIRGGQNQKITPSLSTFYRPAKLSCLSNRSLLLISTVAFIENPITWYFLLFTEVEAVWFAKRVLSTSTIAAARSHEYFYF